MASDPPDAIDTESLAEQVVAELDPGTVVDGKLVLSRRQVIALAGSGLGTGALAMWASGGAAAADGTNDTSDGLVQGNGGGVDVRLDELRDRGGDEVLDIDDTGAINAAVSGRPWKFDSVSTATSTVESRPYADATAYGAETGSDIVPAIDAAFDESKVVLLPEPDDDSNYLISQTLTVPRDHVLLAPWTVDNRNADTEPRIVFDGSGVAVEVERDARLRDFVVVHDTGPTDGDWSAVDGDVGIRFSGTEAKGENIGAVGFDKGIQLWGDTDACAWNHIDPSGIRNCRTGIDLFDGASGYCNENTIEACRLSLNSANTSGDITYGVNFRAASGEVGPNNNKFIGVSAESFYWPLRITGIYNTFIDPRTESPQNPNSLAGIFDESGGATEHSYSWILGNYGNQEFRVRDETGTLRDSGDLRSNTIISRENDFVVPNSTLQLHNSTFRDVRLQYNSTDDLIEFIRGGSKIADLDFDGNLRIAGSLSESSTF